MTRLIGLTGFTGAGKDTVADILVRNHGFTRIAFADPLREALYRLDPIVVPDGGFGPIRVTALVDHMGWDVAKRSVPEVRELLQRFGTEVGREMFGANFWVDRGLDAARKVDGPVVFTDARFLSEVVGIHESGGDIYRVTRPGHGAINNHASEVGIQDDWIAADIENSGSLEALEGTVRSILFPERFAA